MNQIALSGRVGREVELKYLPGSGKAVANFSLAVSRPYTKDKTDWFDVVLWDKSAEFAANNIAKGEQVLVYGYLYFEQWEKDGTKHTRAKVTGQVEKFQWGDKPQGQTKPSSFDDDFANDFRAVEDDDPFF